MKIFNNNIQMAATSVAAFDRPAYNDYDSALAAVSEGKRALTEEEATGGKHTPSDEQQGYTFSQTPPEFQQSRAELLSACVAAHKRLPNMSTDDAKTMYLKVLGRSRYCEHMCWWLEIDNPKSKPRFSLKKWEPRVRAWFALGTDRALVLHPGAERMYYKLPFGDVAKTTLDSGARTVVIRSKSDTRWSVTLYSEECREIQDTIADVLEQHIRNEKAAVIQNRFRDKKKDAGDPAPPPSLKEIEAGAASATSAVSDTKSDALEAIADVENKINAHADGNSVRAAVAHLATCIKLHCKTHKQVQSDVDSVRAILSQLREVVTTVKGYETARDTVSSLTALTACQLLRGLIDPGGGEARPAVSLPDEAVAALKSVLKMESVVRSCGSDIDFAEALMECGDKVSACWNVLAGHEGGFEAVVSQFQETTGSVTHYMKERDAVSSLTALTACRELRQAIDPTGAYSEDVDVESKGVFSGAGGVAGAGAGAGADEAPPAYSELMGDGAAPAATATATVAGDNPEEWSAERVGEWLESIGVDPAQFVAEEVDGVVLKAATNEWLKEDFELTSGGRRKLLMARDDLFGVTAL